MTDMNPGVNVSFELPPIPIISAVARPLVLAEHVLHNQVCACGQEFAPLVGDDVNSAYLLHVAEIIEKTVRAEVYRNVESHHADVKKQSSDPLTGEIGDQYIRGMLYGMSLSGAIALKGLL